MILKKFIFSGLPLILMVNNQFAKNLVGQHPKNSQSFQLAELLLDIMGVRILFQVWHQILIHFDVQRVAQKLNLPDSDIILETSQFNSEVSVGIVFDVHRIPSANICFSFYSFQHIKLAKRSSAVYSETRYFMLKCFLV